MPSFKYAEQLNQWNGARVLGQTNTHGHGYNSVLLLYKAGKCRRVERSLWHIMLITRSHQKTTTENEHFEISVILFLPYYTQ